LGGGAFGVGGGVVLGLTVYGKVRFGGGEP
jgi:hypothetical protein